MGIWRWEAKASPVLVSAFTVGWRPPEQGLIIAKARINGCCSCKEFWFYPISCKLGFLSLGQNKAYNSCLMTWVGIQMKTRISNTFPWDLHFLEKKEKNLCLPKMDMKWKHPSPPKMKAKLLNSVCRKSNCHSHQPCSRKSEGLKGLIDVAEREARNRENTVLPSSQGHGLKSESAIYKQLAGHWGQYYHAVGGECCLQHKCPIKTRRAKEGRKFSH